MESDLCLALSGFFGGPNVAGRDIEAGRSATARQDATGRGKPRPYKEIGGVEKMGGSR